MKRTPKRRWFRAKEYGWGWYPISWEGWVVTVVSTLAYTVGVIGFIGWLGSAREATLQAQLLGIVEFIGFLVLTTFILFKICYQYGEAPRWRWGSPNKKESTKK